MATFQEETRLANGTVTLHLGGCQDIKIPGGKGAPAQKLPLCGSPKTPSVARSVKDYSASQGVLLRPVPEDEMVRIIDLTFPGQKVL